MILLSSMIWSSCPLSLITRVNPCHLLLFFLRYLLRIPLHCASTGPSATASSLATTKAFRWITVRAGERVRGREGLGGLGGESPSTGILYTRLGFLSLTTFTTCYCTLTCSFGWTAIFDHIIMYVTLILPYGMSCWVVQWLFQEWSSHGKELAGHDQELVSMFIKVAHPSPCNANWGLQLPATLHEICCFYWPTVEVYNIILYY